jgi:hypothetical protein
MDEIDIFRSAKVLIDYHGHKARTEALERIANAHEDGNREVEAVWWRILRAIETIQRHEPLASERIN